MTVETGLAGEAALTEGSFWDERFKREGALWGSEASQSAPAASRLFRVWDVARVLVPGCAYGRHCLHFAREGFDVIGLDTSRVALEMARQSADEEGLNIDFIDGDAVRIPLSPGDVDAVYDRALLHLLLADERRRAVAEYRRVLREDAILFLTCFSTEDDEYGEGPEVEPGTFDAFGGRPAHFFTERDLREQLEGFHVSVARLVDEREEHGSTRHAHRFWQVIAEKE